MPRASLFDTQAADYQDFRESLLFRLLLGLIPPGFNRFFGDLFAALRRQGFSSGFSALKTAFAAQGHSSRVFAVIGLYVSGNQVDDKLGALIYVFWWFLSHATSI